MNGNGNGVGIGEDSMEGLEDSKGTGMGRERESLMSH